jgi:hypothetical protein
MLIGTIVLLALAFMAAVSTQAQTPQQQNEVPAQSTSTKGSLVRGRVIYEDTRRPLRRVQVSAYDPASKGLGRHLMAWTNGRGEFQFKDVPAGKYFVAVEAPGIIRPGRLDAKEAQADVTTFTVDGTAQAEVIVRVKRGGAISGKVTYADGDPVVNASIRVLLKNDGKWIPVYTGGRYGDRSLTDERGIYRVSGLSPGEYLVGAAEEKMGIELTAQDDPEGGKMLNRALLSTTYYDGAVSLTAATLLRVEAGDENTDINITLAERSIYSVSGLVMLRGDQRPIARARISLKRKDEELNSNSYSEDMVVNSDEEGRFMFDEAPEGMYVMTVTPAREYRSYREARPASEPKTAPVEKFAAKHQELNVAGDVTSLIVEVSSGGRLSGVLSVDGGKPLPRTIFVFLESASRARLEQLSAQIQADGKFTLEGIPPGSYYLRTSVQPDGEYYTKSVMHGRSDVTREPLAVKEGEDIGDVRMVISADVARLSGQVLAADGKSPERGAGILFLPADPAEQKTMSRRMYGVTNADGGFRVSGAPGDYVAIVVRQGENAYMLRGDQLASRAAKAQRVTLQPGENSRLDLTVPSEK